jgi:hypothetical protein
MEEMRVELFSEGLRDSLPTHRHEHVRWGMND